MPEVSTQGRLIPTQKCTYREEKKPDKGQEKPGVSHMLIKMNECQGCDYNNCTP